MAGDKGPFLTSCIIFFLSIGAAIFQILEEPNWEEASARYVETKRSILRTHSCLTSTDLESILEVVSDAAGQGVTITGDRSINSWDWGNSVIFAATIVTTIGYGNVAPKTSGGRIFCILYGLCGIPLCLVWISELGSFFGDRAKRLSQVLIRKGLSVKKVQFICTAVFLCWGLLVHLLIPPFVFISVEGWSYLEGLYFSFITLTTVGFGDYVAGVNPEMTYPRLYRIGVELWIYMGLAWLSLFFSWNVHMVVSAHKKVMRKRRHRHQHRFPPLQPETRPLLLDDKPPTARPTVIDIFNFLSEEQEDYSTVIKEIGERARAGKATLTSEEEVGRSKSCSDILALDHSPRSRRRRLSVSQVFIRPEEGLLQDSDGDEGLVMEVTQNGGGFEDVGCGPPGSHDQEHAQPPGSHDQDQEHGQPPGGQTMRFNVQNVQSPEDETSRFNVQSPEDETSRFNVQNVQSPEDETSRFNVQNGQSPEDETSRFNVQNGQSPEDETSRFNVQNVQSPKDETSRFNVQNVQSPEDETSRFNVQNGQFPEDETSRFNVQSPEDETSRFNVQNVQSSEDETSRFNVQSPEDETSGFNVQNVQSSEDETSRFNVQSPEDETSRFNVQNVQSPEDETSRFNVQNVQSPEDETSRFNVQNGQSSEDETSRFNVQNVQSPEDETSRFNVQNVQSPEDETSRFNVQNVQSSEDETSRFNVQNGQSSEDETSRCNVQKSPEGREASRFSISKVTEENPIKEEDEKG